jgi:hypothetical protein
MRRWEYYRLLQPNAGNELILELSAGGPGHQRYVSVFNGPDGQLLQKISIPEGSLSSVALGHRVNAAAMVTRLNTAGLALDAHPALQKHWLVVVRRFSCQPGGLLTPEPADVIFASKEVAQGMCFPTELKVAVDAFTMAAISTSPQTRPGSMPLPSPFCPSVSWKICGHTLTPTTDDDIRDLAQQAIRDPFWPDPLVLGQCFLAGKGTELTLPPRPEVSRRRRQFKLPKEFGGFHVALVGNRVVLGNGGPKYLIEFS